MVDFVNPEDIPMDYQHPDWVPRATKVAATAYLLVRGLSGVSLPSFAANQLERLREALDELHAVACGGDPEYINRALKGFAKNLDRDEAPE